MLNGFVMHRKHSNCWNSRMHDGMQDRLAPAEKAEQAAKLAEEKTKQARAEARRKVEQQRETDPGREQLVASC